uniref:Probable endonuclease 4 n=1 Tax=candidate division WOR-3 bacterium TaxID=2052148 RepID=A0A7V3UZR4_UNCW3
MRFGFHISIAGGFANVRQRAEELGCDTIQLFTRTPRGWAASELVPEDVQKFREDIRQSSISPVFAHAPYLPNLAATDSILKQRSIATIVDELKRCEILGIEFLVVHVGKALGTDEKTALKRVADNLNRILDRARNRVMILLENTAGMGSEIGYRFEQIAEIIQLIEDQDRIGVTLDTAHSFAAGYDWRTRAAINETMRQFDQAIGFGKLFLIHLNDSKAPFNSRVDRHWHIGKGEIGLNGFREIVNHPLLSKLPGIMETPRTGIKEDLENMSIIRSLVR